VEETLGGLVSFHLVGPVQRAARAAEDCSRLIQNQLNDFAARFAAID
jgi:hypothetical protein